MVLKVADYAAAADAVAPEAAHEAGENPAALARVV